MTNGHIVVDVVTLAAAGALRELACAGDERRSRSASSPSMVWRLWLRADFLLRKGDTTPVWAMPLWPVAFAMAFGSVFFLTGVLPAPARTPAGAAHRADNGTPPPPPVARRLTANKSAARSEHHGSRRCFPILILGLLFLLLTAGMPIGFAMGLSAFARHAAA